MRYPKSGGIGCFWGYWLRLSVPLWLAAGVATAGDAQLLDLSFEELLGVEIRSAGKRDEQLREIPASVTVIDRDQISRYGWPTLEALLRNVPGLFVLDNIEERFIGTRGAVGGGVQFLVNGIAQHPSLQKTLTVPEIARLNIPIEAIDRVEIIRGPMSVIYGNNAFLGVVNIVTNDIAAHGARVSAGVGNRGGRTLFARTGKATPDGFFSLNIGARRDDGLDGAYADMMSPTQLAQLDPAMHRDMDGDMGQREYSMDLSTGWRELNAELRWTRRDYGIYALTPAFDDGTRIRLDTLHASLGWQRQFGEELGLRITGTHSREDYDSYQTDFLSPDLEGGQDQTSRRWELEIDLHWQPGETLDALFGYRWLRIDGVRNRVEFGFPQQPGSPILLDSVDRLDPYTMHDLFGEVGWNVSDRLRVVAGTRLTLLPDAYRGERDDAASGQLLRAVVRPDNRVEPNGRIALLWSPTRRQLVKLIWGTASQDSADGSFTELERIQTLELNAMLIDQNWMLSTSLFENRIDNIARTIQRLDPNTGNYSSVDDNSGRWRTRGLEVVMDVRPLPRLNLSTSLTWQETKDFSDGIDPGYSPKLLAKLRADWRTGPWSYGAYAHYVDAMEPDWDFIEGSGQRIGETVPDYWNLGVNLRWDPDGAGPFVNLNVSNVLDSEIRYPANELTDFADGLIGPGRRFLATFGYEF